MGTAVSTLAPSTSILTYAPHRWETTASPVGETAPHALDAFAWALGLRFEIPTMDVPLDLATLYREFALEDRELAESGVEDYALLLADAEER